MARRSSRRWSVGHLVCMLLFVLPVGVRLVRDGRRVNAGDLTSVHAIAAAHELRLELQRAQGELEALGALPYQARYGRVLASVLPIGDLSSDRSSMIAVTRGATPLPAGAAVVTLRNGLVGHSDGAFESVRAGQFRVVRVQTVLDRGFRVRFESEHGSGILEGTGVVGASGRPLLTARIFDGEAPPPVGTPLQTHDAFGAFPPGILIGVVVSGEAEGLLPEDRRLTVEASVRIDELRDVILRPDLMDPTYLEVSTRRSS